jgi:hypothetical protein
MKMPFSNNLGFGKVWKVFTRNYKVHNENMVSPSQFPSNITKIVTNERKKQHITQARFEHQILKLFLTLVRT